MQSGTDPANNNEINMVVAQNQKNVAKLEGIRFLHGDLGYHSRTARPRLTAVPESRKASNELSQYQRHRRPVGVVPLTPV